MTDELQGLKDLVQEAIDKGATSVEEVHRSIAALPFAVLERIEPLAEPARTMKDLQQQSIGFVYDAIRRLNRVAGEIAEELLQRARSS
jgi:hypothetical protein